MIHQQTSPLPIPPPTTKAAIIIPPTTLSERSTLPDLIYPPAVQQIGEFERGGKRCASQDNKPDYFDDYCYLLDYNFDVLDSLKGLLLLFLKLKVLLFYQSEFKDLDPSSVRISFKEVDKDCIEVV